MSKKSKYVYVIRTISSEGQKILSDSLPDVHELVDEFIGNDTAWSDKKGHVLVLSVEKMKRKDYESFEDYP